MPGVCEHFGELTIGLVLISLVSYQGRAGKERAC